MRILQKPLNIEPRTIKSGSVVATTSGTSVDITGIPPWVKRITVPLSAISMNGTAVLMIQIGDSGGIEATTYTSAYIELDNATAVVGATETTGMLIGGVVATTGIQGIGTLVLIDAATNKWVWTCVSGRDDAATTALAHGNKSLSATLDRIRLTTVAGTATFDSGAINILYE